MRGGKSWGGNKGPKLPAKLTKELFGASPGDASGGRRGPSRKDRRRTDKDSRKQARSTSKGPDGRGNKTFTTNDNAPRRESGDKRKERDTSAAPPAAKRNRPSGNGSKFDELLPPAQKERKSQKGAGSNKWQTPDAELALQRELARKLGMKKKGRKAQLGGDDDGLDELFQELGGLEDVLGSDSDGDDGDRPEPAHSRKVKPSKQKYLKEAPSSSEDNSADLGSDGEYSSSEGEEEEMSDSDSDSDSEGGGRHLGGLSEEDHEHDDLGFDLLEESSSEEESSEEGDSGSELGNILDRESSEEEEDEEGKVADHSGKYIPPAVRRAQLAAAGRGTGLIDADTELTIRRVRGLVNRLAEANLQGIVGELSELYQNEGRSVVSNAVSSELISAAAEGPRASERFAVVAAAAISGLAGQANSTEVAATFLSKVAVALEDALARDDSLASGNLVRVMAQLYLCGAVKPDILYSLLERWLEKFTENEVASMASLLGGAGLALRAADPERMKEFVVAVHARASEVKTLSMRARVMLDLVVDIKNNRKREDGKRKAAAALPPATSKWLKGCGVDAVAVGGISWEKIAFGDKRGIWWMPTAADAAANISAANARGGGGADVAAAAAAAGIGADAGITAPELLKLAAAMRMNTDTRRAVFCAVMGSEDAVDATEKLLRLNLKGEQEREVVRVTVECCLHEASYNPYYAHLLTRVCSAAKGHRVTFQFCLWDHFKEISGMGVRRMTVLARLAAAAVATGALPLSMLKSVDFSHALSAREVLFWRLFFEHLLEGCKKDKDVSALFERVAAQQQLSGLRVALLAFLKRTVGPWLAMKDPEDTASGGAERLELLLRRCRMAERALGTPRD